MSTQTLPVGSPAMLLDVQTVADVLGCSTRHVQRLSDRGRMPTPVKLGALVRWPRATIEDWIAEGCPSHRPTRLEVKRAR